MSDLLVEAALKYAALCILLLLAGIGLPIPEEITLLTAGLLVAEGLGNLPFAIGLMISFVVLTDLIPYLIGYRYGHHVPNLPGLRVILSPRRLARAETAFSRHGGKTIFFGRFIPGFRSTIFFTAGTFKTPLVTFLAYDFSAACISVPIMVLLGYSFADEFDLLTEWVLSVRQYLLVVVLSVTALLLLAWLTRMALVIRRMRRIRQRRSDRTAG